MVAGDCMTALGPPLQAEIVPFRLAKMKGAPPKDEVPLKTCPVGPWGPLDVVGMPMLPVGGLSVVTLLTS